MNRKIPRLAGLAALYALLLPLAASAQEVKVGFVDHEKALFSTEQGKKARAELQSKVTAAKSQLQPMADTRRTTGRIRRSARRLDTRRSTSRSTRC